MTDYERKHLLQDRQLALKRIEKENEFIRRIDEQLAKFDTAEKSSNGGEPKRESTPAK